MKTIKLTKYSVWINPNNEYEYEDGGVVCFDVNDFSCYESLNSWGIGEIIRLCLKNGEAFYVDLSEFEKKFQKPE